MTLGWKDLVPAMKEIVWLVWIRHCKAQHAVSSDASVEYVMNELPFFHKVRFIIDELYNVMYCDEIGYALLSSAR